MEISLNSLRNEMFIIKKNKKMRKMKYQRRADWARHDKMMLLVACGGAGVASLSRENEVQLIRHTLSQSHLLFD